MYSMWKIMCFLNLEPCKHIALHQIHKIMLFLATSYDPFNSHWKLCTWLGQGFSRQLLIVNIMILLVNIIIYIYIYIYIVYNSGYLLRKKIGSILISCL